LTDFISFAVRCAGPRGILYVDCMVFPTVSQARSALRDCEGCTAGNDWRALFVPVADKPPLVGTVWLGRNDLNAGIVAHEMYHAALEYTHRKRGVKDREETTACAIETMVNQFWHCYYAYIARYE